MSPDRRDRRDSRDRRENELDEEIRSHLDMAVRERLERGEGASEAAFAARREFGNILLVKEVTREMWGWRWLERSLQDLRYAARLLLRNPAFALVAVLSLALGIGANAALFEVLDAVRFRTLPIPRAAELFEIRLTDMTGARGTFNGWHQSVTYPIWEQIRDRQEAFTGVFAFAAEDFNLAVGGPSRAARGLWVSGTLFDVLGIRPSLGRVLAGADDRRGCGAPAAVISHAFWQREFGGTPSVLGKTVTLDGHPVQVVGVTEPRFFGLEVGRSFDIAVPLCAEPSISGGGGRLDSGTTWWLTVMGRLKPGWSNARATAHLNAISADLFKAILPAGYPAASVDKYLKFKLEAAPASSGISQIRESYETPLWLLLATAAVVLLIACTNLANLLLARATARSREIAVRLSLGASRARVAWQLIIESLLLASLGAAGGIALAGVLSRTLVAYLDAEGNSIVLDLGIDWHVLAFTAGLALLTSLLFGVLPALRATRTEIAAVFKGAARGFTASRERAIARQALVVCQIAMSLVLLVVAFLFARSLRNLLLVDPGFQADNVIIVGLDLRRVNLPIDARRAYKSEVLARLRSAPGVDSAAATSMVPVSGDVWANNVWLSVDSEQKSTQAVFNRVSSGFFKTLRIPFVAGRDFDDEHDTPSSSDVAVVNEAFARDVAHGRNPVGLTLVVEQTPTRPQKSYVIVGIVRDAKYTDLREPFRATVFLAASQDPRPSPFLLTMVRATRDPAAVWASLPGVLAQVNPEIGITPEKLTTKIQRTLVLDRLMATLSLCFGALAGVLATIGLYGLIAYTVARRTNEIGVRMALGASRRQIAELILREAMVLLGWGLLAGISLALGGTRAANMLLFGLTSHDPVTLALASALLGGITVAATYAPARRAMRIEPTVALRAE